MAETINKGRWSPWRFAGWGTAALLLLVPLVAMQFTEEVNWTASDFAFAAGVFGSVGLGLELAVRNGNAAYRMAAGVALAVAFLLVWINGAVGIIGSEQEDANMLFGGVIAVAVLGASIARFRPAGMARAMAAAALAQLLVPPIASAFVAGASAWAPEVLASTAVAVAMWLLSAWLFAKAARDQGVGSKP